MAPLDECWSPGQSSQNAAEVIAEKVPASHGRHSDWPVPPCALPGEHPAQLVADVFAANFPARQARQLTAPSIDEWKPWRQSVHSDWPVPPCALPGEHSVQLVAEAFGANLPELHTKQLPWPSTSE